MKFRINKKHGDVIVTDTEIIKTVHEQLQMIPGIRVAGTKNLVDRLFTDTPIQVYQVRTNTIGISAHIRLNSYVNIIEASRGVQENIKFFIEKKYGVLVDHVDIKVEGIENAR